MKTLQITSLLLFGVGQLLAAPPSEDGKERERGPSKGQRRSAQERGHFASFVRTADKNGDGAVSFEEFSELERLASLPEAKRREIFKRLDKNGDGMIREEELRGERRPGEGRPPIPRLKELDKSGDGSVSFEEFVSSEFVKRLPEERRRDFFNRLDRNKDGVISAADEPERMRRGGPPNGKGRRGGGRPEGDSRVPFQQLDEDADGKISFAEFRKAPWIKDLGEDEQEGRFEALDKDGNLSLDKQELPKPAAKPSARPRPTKRDGKRSPDGKAPEGGREKAPPEGA